MRKMRNGICVQAKHGLTLKWRNKTKCGLRRAHLCILSEMSFESKCGRKARVLQEELFLVGDHPHFWFPSDQGGRRKLGQRVPKDSRYEPKP